MITITVVAFSWGSQLFGECKTIKMTSLKSVSASPGYRRCTAAGVRTVRFEAPAYRLVFVLSKPDRNLQVSLLSM